jgi:hypothetical protein
MPSIERVKVVATVALTAAFLATGSPPARAAAVAAEETNPYILELLKRTEENREARAKENLEHYTNKVFSDYFDVYTDRDLSPELTAEIAAWRAAHLGK